MDDEFHQRELLEVSSYIPDRTALLKAGNAQEYEVKANQMVAEATLEVGLQRNELENQKRTTRRLEAEAFRLRDQLTAAENESARQMMDADKKLSDLNFELKETEAGHSEDSHLNPDPDPILGTTREGETRRTRDPKSSL